MSTRSSTRLRTTTTRVTRPIRRCGAHEPSLREWLGPPQAQTVDSVVVTDDARPLLKIAVPNKGSLAEPAAQMLREAGYRQRWDPKDLVLTD